MMPTLSSLAAPEIVITTSGAIGDRNFAILTFSLNGLYKYLIKKNKWTAAAPFAKMV